MRRSYLTATICLALLAGCSTPIKRVDTEAVRDYIAAAELAEADQIRFPSLQQPSHRPINEEFALLESRGDHFLLEFRRRCFALYDSNLIAPDVRRESNTIRARFDTIRGRYIDKIYRIDEAQALELGQLGDAPGDDSVTVDP